ncbi:MAG TPA: diaminopropionate ammonia-lyase [Solirubrobacteraceae bacterium]|nr:diaminopropionate ammonia-lyase [Solirubrobacteraceae bacterium]
MSAERVLRRPRAAGSLEVAPPGGAPLRFHASMDGYAPTPLRAAPAAAAALGVAEVLVKDESARLGMPSFKILGASWAVHRALVARAGRALAEVPGLAALAALAEGMRPLRLSAATDGNHGRAVAHMARLLGLEASVYVPQGTAQARIDGIASEGAAVSVVDGGYDDAVRRSALDAGERCLVISDTSWPGYQDVPRWVIEGYETIFAEIDEEAPGRFDAVAIPIGVGALAAAAIAHFWAGGGPRPALVGVEPTSAACVLASVEAGDIVSLTEPQESIMAGLNCATPSLVAWPLTSRGIDVYVAIDDARVPGAMRMLAQDGIVAGETGAAGLAGMRCLAEQGDPAPLGPEARVLLIVTEGATDPEAYARLLG